jgi:hypothetical protein
MGTEVLPWYCHFENWAPAVIITVSARRRVRFRSIGQIPKRPKQVPDPEVYSTCCPDPGLSLSFLQTHALLLTGCKPQSSTAMKEIRVLVSLIDLENNLLGNLFHEKIDI